MSPLVEPHEQAAAKLEVAVGSPQRGPMAPEVRTRLIGSVLFILAAVLVLTGGSAYTIYTATLVAIYGIVTVSQEWLFGRAGQISLGAAAMMAIGAYTTSYLSDKSWAVFPIPLIVALILGGIVGLIIGIPGLRLTGLYLMLTTLALQFVVSFAGQKSQGVAHEAGFLVTAPKWGSYALNQNRPLFIISAIVLGLSLLALDGMYHGLPGRAWSAIRQNEPGAAVVGVNIVKWKLLAYVGSSALTAAGGSLYAYQVGAVSYASFSLDLSLALLIMVFVGGTGTKVGPLIGAVVVVLLPEQLQSASTALSAHASISAWLNTNEAFLSSAVYGAALLLILLFERGGLFAIGRRIFYGIGRLVMLARAARA